MNSGNQDLTLNSQELNGPYQLQAADSNACQFPGTLTPDASCSLEIEGAMPGRIDPGSLILFDSALHRVAIHPVLLQFEFPNPVLSATSLNFGNYAVQGQFGGNQWLSLSNPDSKASLVVHSLTFTGANAGDFSISPGSSCTFVDVGSGCQLNVTFTPQGAGPRTASLVITSNAAESPQTVELTGGAVTPPQISVNTETLSFGEQVIETRGEIKSVTVSNTGGASLIFLPASNVFLSTSADSGFSIVQSTCPAIELAAGQSCTFAIEFKPRLVGLRTARLFIYYKIAGMQSSSVVSIDGTGIPPPKFRFIPIEPCRVADTRNATSPYGGPAIAAQSTRDFDVPGSTCGVPANAAAYAMNVTVVPEGPLSWLTVWPSGQPKPTVSTLNSYDGKIKANAVIVPAGINGAISLFATDQTEAILDINGYFAPVSDSAGLSFYPLPACRVTDTREPDPGFGGPALRANQEREIAILTSQCHIPAGAQAYSLNFTAVPRTALGYLTVWPSGRSRPLVSTLNSPTGTVVANAAIVPAGQGGDISVYATDDSELIIDVNGYFAPPGPEGLSLYTVAPCRVLDSRDDQLGQLEGARRVASNTACTIPGGARAIVYNATVVPNGSLSYLSLWSDDQEQPVVSTLNAVDGSVTSNMAIVPTATGSIHAFAAGETHLLLDASAYFAQ